MHAAAVHVARLWSSVRDAEAREQDLGGAEAHVEESSPGRERRRGRGKFLSKKWDAFEIIG